MIKLIRFSMRLPFKKVLAVGLAGVLFYEIAAIPLAEANQYKNVWESRRKANPVLASGKLFEQIPSASSALPQTNNLNSTIVADKAMSHVSASLRSVIQAVPLLYGTVKQMYDPKNAASAPVVLVQDIHQNAEAQNNIAAVLEQLITDKKIDVVGVEAAFGSFDFSPFYAFPDVAVVKEVAQELLDKHVISAPSYVGLTHAKGLPVFLGVDDEKDHAANVAAYLQTRSAVASAEKAITKEQATLEKEKVRVFSSELKRFDGLREGFQNGAVGFGAYLKQLIAMGAEADFVVERFVMAYDMESKIDFARVDQERKTVIEKLIPMLNDKEVNDLLVKSAAYRLGRLNYGAYYGDLKNLCQAKGVNLSTTPAFDNYIRYVLLSDGIPADELFDRLAEMESTLLAKLVTTPEQKALAEKSEYLGLSRKLVKFELTPKEWERYQALRTPGLEKYEQFYGLADRRSAAMVNKLLGNKFRKGAVVVSGGYHTPEIFALLKAKKVPVIVVAPKLTKVSAEDGSAYLTVFAREKTPLDKLFAGEKLFVGNPAEMVGATGAAAQAQVSANRLARVTIAFRTLLKMPGVAFAALTGIVVKKYDASKRQAQMTVDGVAVTATASGVAMSGAMVSPLGEQFQGPNAAWTVASVLAAIGIKISYPKIKAWASAKVGQAKAAWSVRGVVIAVIAGVGIGLFLLNPGFLSDLYFYSDLGVLNQAMQGLTVAPVDGLDWMNTLTYSRVLIFPLLAGLLYKSLFSLTAFAAKKVFGVSVQTRQGQPILHFLSDQDDYLRAISSRYAAVMTPELLDVLKGKSVAQLRRIYMDMERQSDSMKPLARGEPKTWSKVFLNVINPLHLASFFKTFFFSSYLNQISYSLNGQFTSSFENTDAHKKLALGIVNEGGSVGFARSAAWLLWKQDIVLVGAIKFFWKRLPMIVVSSLGGWLLLPLLPDGLFVWEGVGAALNAIGVGSIMRGAWDSLPATDATFGWVRRYAAEIASHMNWDVKNIATSFFNALGLLLPSTFSSTVRNVRRNLAEQQGVLDIRRQASTLQILRQRSFWRAWTNQFRTQSFYMNVVDSTWGMMTLSAEISVALNMSHDLAGDTGATIMGILEGRHATDASGQKISLGGSAMDFGNEVVGLAAAVISAPHMAVTNAPVRVAQEAQARPTVNRLGMILAGVTALGALVDSLSGSKQDPVSQDPQQQRVQATKAWVEKNLDPKYKFPLENRGDDRLKNVSFLYGTMQRVNQLIMEKRLDEAKALFLNATINKGPNGQFLWRRNYGGPVLSVNMETEAAFESRVKNGVTLQVANAGLNLWAALEGRDNTVFEISKDALDHVVDQQAHVSSAERAGAVVHGPPGGNQGFGDGTRFQDVLTPEYQVDLYRSAKIIGDLTGEARYQTASANAVDYLVNRQYDKDNKRFFARDDRGNLSAPPDVPGWALSMIGPEILAAKGVDVVRLIDELGDLDKASGDLSLPFKTEFLLIRMVALKDHGLPYLRALRAQGQAVDLEKAERELQRLQQIIFALPIQSDKKGGGWADGYKLKNSDRDPLEPSSWVAAENESTNWGWAIQQGSSMNAAVYALFFAENFDPMNPPIDWERLRSQVPASASDLNRVRHYEFGGGGDASILESGVYLNAAQDAYRAGQTGLAKIIVSPHPGIFENDRTVIKGEEQIATNVDDMVKLDDTGLDMVNNEKGAFASINFHNKLTEQKFIRLDEKTVLRMGDAFGNGQPRFRYFVVDPHLEHPASGYEVVAQFYYLTEAERLTSPVKGKEEEPSYEAWIQDHPELVDPALGPLELDVKTGLSKEMNQRGFRVGKYADMVVLDPTTTKILGIYNDFLDDPDAPEIVFKTHMDKESKAYLDQLRQNDPERYARTFVAHGDNVKWVLGVNTKVKSPLDMRAKGPFANPEDNVRILTNARYNTSRETNIVTFGKIYLEGLERGMVIRPTPEAQYGQPSTIYLRPELVGDRSFLKKHVFLDQLEKERSEHFGEQDVQQHLDNAFRDWRLKMAWLSDMEAYLEKRRGTGDLLATVRATREQMVFDPVTRTFPQLDLFKTVTPRVSEYEKGMWEFSDFLLQIEKEIREETNVARRQHLWDVQRQALTQLVWGNGSVLIPGNRDAQRTLSVLRDAYGLNGKDRQENPRPREPWVFSNMEKERLPIPLSEQHRKYNLMFAEGNNVKESLRQWIRVIASEQPAFIQIQNNRGEPDQFLKGPDIRIARTGQAPRPLSAVSTPLVLTDPSNPRQVINDFDARIEGTMQYSRVLRDERGNVEREELYLLGRRSFTLREFETRVAQLIESGEAKLLQTTFPKKNGTGLEVEANTPDGSSQRLRYNKPDRTNPETLLLEKEYARAIKARKEVYSDHKFNPYSGTWIPGKILVSLDGKPSQERELALDDRGDPLLDEEGRAIYKTKYVHNGRVAATFDLVEKVEIDGLVYSQDVHQDEDVTKMERIIYDVERQRSIFSRTGQIVLIPKEVVEINADGSNGASRGTYAVTEQFDRDGFDVVGLSVRRANTNGTVVTKDYEKAPAGYSDDAGEPHSLRLKKITKSNVGVENGEASFTEENIYYEDEAFVPERIRESVASTNRAKSSAGIEELGRESFLLVNGARTLLNHSITHKDLDRFFSDADLQAKLAGTTISERFDWGVNEDGKIFPRQNEIQFFDGNQLVARLDASRKLLSLRRGANEITQSKAFPNREKSGWDEYRYTPEKTRGALRQYSVDGNVADEFTVRPDQLANVEKTFHLYKPIRRGADTFVWKETNFLDGLGQKVGSLRIDPMYNRLDRRIAEFIEYGRDPKNHLSGIPSRRETRPFLLDEKKVGDEVYGQGIRVPIEANVDLRIQSNDPSHLKKVKETLGKAGVSLFQIEDKRSGRSWKAFFDPEHDDQEIGRIKGKGIYRALEVPRHKRDMTADELARYDGVRPADHPLEGLDVVEAATYNFNGNRIGDMTFRSSLSREFDSEKMGALRSELKTAGFESFSNNLIDTESFDVQPLFLPLTPEQRENPEPIKTFTIVMKEHQELMKFDHNLKRLGLSFYDYGNPWTIALGLDLDYQEKLGEPLAMSVSLPEKSGRYRNQVLDIGANIGFMEELSKEDGVREKTQNGIYDDGFYYSQDKKKEASKAVLVDIAKNRVDDLLRLYKAADKSDTAASFTSALNDARARILKNYEPYAEIEFEYNNFADNFKVPGRQPTDIRYPASFLRHLGVASLTKTVLFSKNKAGETVRVSDKYSSTSEMVGLAMKAGPSGGLRAYSLRHGEAETDPRLGQKKPLKTDRIEVTNQDGVKIETHYGFTRGATTLERLENFRRSLIFRAFLGGDLARFKVPDKTITTVVDENNEFREFLFQKSNSTERLAAGYIGYLTQGGVSENPVPFVNGEDEFERYAELKNKFDSLRFDALHKTLAEEKSPNGQLEMISKYAKVDKNGFVIKDPNFLTWFTRLKYGRSTNVTLFHENVSEESLTYHGDPDRGTDPAFYTPRDLFGLMNDFSVESDEKYPDAILRYNQIVDRRHGLALKASAVLNDGRPYYDEYLGRPGGTDPDIIRVYYSRYGLPEYALGMNRDGSKKEIWRQFFTKSWVEGEDIYLVIIEIDPVREGVEKAFYPNPSGWVVYKNGLFLAKKDENSYTPNEYKLAYRPSGVFGDWFDRGVLGEAQSVVEKVSQQPGLYKPAPLDNDVELTGKYRTARFWTTNLMVAGILLTVMVIIPVFFWWVLRFLVKPINLNTASEKELEQVFSVGDATRILQLRLDKGFFDTVNDIRPVLKDVKDWPKIEKKLGVSYRNGSTVPEKITNVFLKIMGMRAQPPTGIKVADIQALRLLEGRITPLLENPLLAPLSSTIKNLIENEFLTTYQVTLTVMEMTEALQGQDNRVSAVVLQEKILSRLLTRAYWGFDEKAKNQVRGLKDGVREKFKAEMQRAFRDAGKDPNDYDTNRWIEERLTRFATSVPAERVALQKPGLPEPDFKEKDLIFLDQDGVWFMTPLRRYTLVKGVGPRFIPFFNVNPAMSRYLAQKLEDLMVQGKSPEEIALVMKNQELFWAQLLKNQLVHLENLRDPRVRGMAYKDETTRAWEFLAKWKELDAALNYMQGLSAVELNGKLPDRVVNRFGRQKLDAAQQSFRDLMDKIDRGDFGMSGDAKKSMTNAEIRGLINTHIEPLVLGVRKAYRMPLVNSERDYFLNTGINITILRLPLFLLKLIIQNERKFFRSPALETVIAYAGSAAIGVLAYFTTESIFGAVALASVLGVIYRNVVKPLFPFEEHQLPHQQETFLKDWRASAFWTYAIVLSLSLASFVTYWVLSNIGFMPISYSIPLPFLGEVVMPERTRIFFMVLSFLPLIMMFFLTFFGIYNFLSFMVRVYVAFKYVYAKVRNFPDALKRLPDIFTTKWDVERMKSILKNWHDKVLISTESFNRMTVTLERMKVAMETGNPTAKAEAIEMLAEQLKLMETDAAKRGFIDWMNKFYRKDMPAMPTLLQSIRGVTYSIKGYGENPYFLFKDFNDFKKNPKTGQPTHTETQFGLIARSYPQRWTLMVQRMKENEWLKTGEEAVLLALVNSPSNVLPDTLSQESKDFLEGMANKILAPGLENAISASETAKETYRLLARQIVEENGIGMSEADIENFVNERVQVILDMESTGNTFLDNLRKSFKPAFKGQKPPSLNEYMSQLKAGMPFPPESGIAPNIQKFVRILNDEGVVLLHGGRNNRSIIHPAPAKYGQMIPSFLYARENVVFLDWDMIHSLQETLGMPNALLSMYVSPENIGSVYSQRIMSAPVSKFGEASAMMEEGFIRGQLAVLFEVAGILAYGKFMRKAAMVENRGELLEDDMVAEDAMGAKRVLGRGIGSIQNNAFINIQKGLPTVPGAMHTPWVKWSSDSGESTFNPTSVEYYWSPYIHWTEKIGTLFGSFFHFLKKPAVRLVTILVLAIYYHMDLNPWFGLPLAMWINSVLISQAIAIGAMNPSWEDRGFWKGTYRYLTVFVRVLFVAATMMIVVYGDTVSKGLLLLTRFILTGEKGGPLRRSSFSEIYILTGAAVMSGLLLTTVIFGFSAFDWSKFFMWSPQIATVMFGWWMGSFLINIHTKLSDRIIDTPLNIFIKAPLAVLVDMLNKLPQAIKPTFLIVGMFFLFFDTSWSPAVGVVFLIGYMILNSFEFHLWRFLSFSRIFKRDQKIYADALAAMREADSLGIAGADVDREALTTYVGFPKMEKTGAGETMMVGFNGIWNSLSSMMWEYVDDVAGITKKGIGPGKVTWQTPSVVHLWKVRTHTRELLKTIEKKKNPPPAGPAITANPVPPVSPAPAPVTPPVAPTSPVSPAPSAPAAPVVPSVTRSQAMATFGNVLREFIPVIEGQQSDIVAQAAILNLLEGSPLKMEYDRVSQSPTQRTGSVYGDASELLAQNIIRNTTEETIKIDRATHYLFTRSLRRVLTGESNGLFAGSLRALALEMVSEPHFEFRLTDKAENTDKIVREAKRAVQNLKQNKSVLGICFVADSTEIYDALLMNFLPELRAGTVRIVNRQANMTFTNIRDMAMTGPRFKNYLPKAKVNILIPKGLQDRLPEGFFDIPEADQARYRCFLMVTETMNAMAVEFPVGQLNDLLRKLELTKIAA